MNFQRKNNLLALVLPGVLMAFALNAQDLLPQNFEASEEHPWLLEKMNPDDDWTRHFRIGALVGFNIKANFNMSGNFNVAYPNGVYDDGYVHPDSRNNPTYTSYFGFDNSSQYNGSTITMSRVTSYSVTSGGSGSSNAGLTPGFDLVYGDSYWYWAHGKLGWELGLGILPIHIANSAPITSATVTPTEYQFDANGNFYIPPNYQGVYQNDGNSPDLPNLSNYQTPTIINGTPVSADGGISTRSLDVMLYTFRLGPTMYWDWDEHVGFYAGAGPAVGLVSGNLNYSDSIAYNGGATTAHNRGDISGTSLTYGGYVNATIVYHAVEGGDFYLGAQLMPMSSATISGGGRSGKLDLSGQLYITAGINWPF